MTNRWRRVEKLPLAYEGNLFALQRYYVTSRGGKDVDADIGVATYEEASLLAERLRHTDAQIVTIARVEVVWKRQ